MDHYQIIRQHALVHGDGAARPALADRLYRSTNQHRKVHLPRTGDSLQFGRRAPARASAPQPVPSGIGQDKALDAATLPRLIEHLHSLKSTAPWSPAALLDLWYGTGAWDEAHFAALVALLTTKPPGLRRHPKRPQLYQVIDPTAPAPTPAKPASQRWGEQEMKERVLQELGDAPDLYHVGFHLGMRQVRLRFAFPEVAAEHNREQFARIVEDTGWTVHLNKGAHQERLAEAACALVPEGYTLRKSPALHMETKTVTLILEATPPADVVSTMAAALYERTGFTLVCQGPEPQLPQLGPVQATPPAMAAAPLEINAAFQAITTAFATCPATAQPYRKSLKNSPDGALIELAFLTPEIAAQHSALLQQLSALTGYAFAIKAEPNQNGLVTYLQAVIPAAWQMQSTPSILHAAKRIRVACANPPRPGSSAYLLVAERVYQETGWTLAVETRRRKT